MNYKQSLVKIMNKNGMDLCESKIKSTPVAKVAPELKNNVGDTEITKNCAVSGCEEYKNLSAEEFFRFPEDPKQKQIWTDLTGRNNWTPTDFSYICIQHFSVDCFMCDVDNQVVLTDQAVPTLKLPRHVLEVEYIDEDSLDNDNDGDNEMDEDYTEDDTEMATDNYKLKSKEENPPARKENAADNVELLKLFTEVQMMQRQAVGLKDKLKFNMKIYNRQGRFLNRLKQIIEMKKGILLQKRKKKARILLSLQDKIKEDTTGLVMAMPTRHTDDLKNFALSIYKYSPQAYIYIRNSLRTMLPSTDVLDSWISSGHQPKNVLLSNNLIKVTAEQTESELSCKISLR